MLPSIPLDQLSAIEMTSVLAFASIAFAALILLTYLNLYVQVVLADPRQGRWWSIGLGVGAGVVYGGAGLLAVFDVPWAGALTRGSGLFFMLFLALGLRMLYRLSPVDGSQTDELTWLVDILVLGGFILAWWASFLTGRAAWTVLIEVAGWFVAAGWVLRYGVGVVVAHEGTSIAAIVRHLLPALVCFAAVMLADLSIVYSSTYRELLSAVSIVGTVLVAAFLFNTAAAIRQQAGEVERLYDWTTWRGD